MTIDDKLINYLEELSRLRLSDEEKDVAKEDLSKILNYIDTLNEVNVNGFEEMSHPFSNTNNFREDEVTNSDIRDLILSNTYESKDGYFKVPKTLE